MSFAIPAQMRGGYTQGVVGVDFERAGAERDVPPGYGLERAIASGRVGDPAPLSEELQARGMPNGRKPLAEIALEAGFKG